MKPAGVDLKYGEHRVFGVPTNEGERVLAHCIGMNCLGKVVRLHDVPPEVVKAIDAGDDQAFLDCIHPEGEHGAHRISIGNAFLGQIDGLDPEEFLPITRSSIFETTPEG